MKPGQWAMLAMGFAALLGSSAQILFKKAKPEFNASIITNWWLIAGLVLYGVAFIINLVAYRYGQASTLYPIIALSYLFVVVLAAVFLGEGLSWLKVTGAIVILVGVALVANG